MRGGPTKTQVIINKDGSFMPFNEPGNMYAKCVLDFVLDAFRKTTGTVKGEVIAKKVIIDKMMQISTVAGITYTKPTDRMVSIVYRTLVGFATKGNFNECLFELTMAFIGMRLGKMRVDLPELLALFKACNAYYGKYITDSKGKAPTENQLIWKAMLIKLVNGQLKHFGCPEVPFELTTKAAKKAAKERIVHDLKTMMEGEWHWQEACQHVRKLYVKLW